MTFIEVSAVITVVNQQKMPMICEFRFLKTQMGLSQYPQGRQYNLTSWNISEFYEKSSNFFLKTNLLHI